jgi:proteasome accessory factor C
MDNGQVTVSEAATQFSRQPEDIRRAVELIACAGIPGDSAAYLHADLFDIDWDALENDEVIRFSNTVVIDRQPRLSTREISALIAGLQYLAAHPRYGEREDVRALLEKLRAVSGTSEPAHIGIQSVSVSSALEIIDGCLRAGTQLRFDYVNRNGDADTRTVDPLAVETRDDVWYLRAWCLLREAPRLFRLDRMANVTGLDTPVSDHPDVDDPESWTIFTASDTDVVVTLEFDEPALPIVGEYLDRSRPPQRTDSGYVAQVPFAHYGSLVRFVAAQGGLVRVTAPEAAIQAVRDWVSRAQERAVPSG